MFVVLACLFIGDESFFFTVYFIEHFVKRVLRFELLLMLMLLLLLFVFIVVVVVAVTVFVSNYNFVR